MSEALHIVCPHCHATNRVPAVRLADGAKCGSCKNSLFNTHPIELKSADFQKHIANSDIPVVVDFWAPWCGPCRMMAPIFEQAAAELEPNVRLAKVDVDAEQSIGARFNIRSIPTTVLFKSGQEIARQAGAMDLGNLIRWVKSHT